MDAEVKCVIDGEYEGTPVLLGGSCASEGGPITVSLSPNLVRTTQDPQRTFNVVTMVVVKGCSVRLTREITSSFGELTERLFADNLELQPDDTLEGSATLTRFEDFDVDCEAMYSITLQRSGM